MFFITVKTAEINFIFFNTNYIFLYFIIYFLYIFLCSEYEKIKKSNI